MYIISKCCEGSQDFEDGCGAQKHRGAVVVKPCIFCQAVYNEFLHLSHSEGLEYKLGQDGAEARKSEVAKEYT